MDPSDMPRNNARSIFELKGLNKHFPCRSLTSATLALLTKGKLVWPWVLTSQTSSTTTCIADHNESSRELWRIPASLPRDIPSPNCNLLLLHYLHWCSKCSKVSGNCIMWKSANLHGYVSECLCHMYRISVYIRTVIKAVLSEHVSLYRFWMKNKTMKVQGRASTILAVDEI